MRFSPSDVAPAVAGSLAPVLVAGMMVMAATPASAQPPPNWVGAIRCDIQAQASGYFHQELQTWTLTGGAPKVQGSMTIYPATWSVVGGGWHDRTRASARRIAQWSASVSNVDSPLRFTRHALGREFDVAKWESQQAVSRGYAGTEQYINSGVPQTAVSLSATVYAWQFPRIDAAVTEQQLIGSGKSEVKVFVGPLQPGDAVVTVACTWSLGVGAAQPLPPPTYAPLATPPFGANGVLVREPPTSGLSKTAPASGGAAGGAAAAGAAGGAVTGGGAAGAGPASGATPSGSAAGAGAAAGGAAGGAATSGGRAGGAAPASEPTSSGGAAGAGAGAGGAAGGAASGGGGAAGAATGSGATSTGAGAGGGAATGGAAGGAAGVAASGTGAAAGVPGPDLSVTLVANTAPSPSWNLGRPLHYTVRVRNPGSTAIVADLLAPLEGQRWTSASCTPRCVALREGSYRLNLPAGAEATVDIYGIAITPGSATVTATIVPPDGMTDPNPGNNSARVTTAVR